jgi:hypothetical protein
LAWIQQALDRTRNIKAKVFFVDKHGLIMMDLSLTLLVEIEARLVGGTAWNKFLCYLGQCSMPADGSFWGSFYLEQFWRPGF